MTLQPAQDGTCPGCMGRGMMEMGWPMMILGALLIGAIIATLIALTVFLVKRSQVRP